MICGDCCYWIFVGEKKGLVRSPVSATLPQIGSRLYVTWGILWSFPEVSLRWIFLYFFQWKIVEFYVNCCYFLQTRTHILVSSLVISWSITEVIINFVKLYSSSTVFITKLVAKLHDLSFWSSELIVVMLRDVSFVLYSLYIQIIIIL